MGAPKDGSITSDRLVDNCISFEGHKRSNQQEKIVYRLNSLADYFDHDDTIYVLFILRSFWGTLADCRCIDIIVGFYRWPVYWIPFLQVFKRYSFLCLNKRYDCDSSRFHSFYF